LLFALGAAARGAVSESYLVAVDTVGRLTDCAVVSSEVRARLGKSPRTPSQFSDDVLAVAITTRAFRLASSTSSRTPQSTPPGGHHGSDGARNAHETGSRLMGVK
jgi:hypothetical protein